MCRSIKTLREAEVTACEDDIHAAALQFVRKISGFTKPTKANAEAFDLAVAEITAASQKLLDSLTIGGKPTVRV